MGSDGQIEGGVLGSATFWGCLLEEQNTKQLYDNKIKVNTIDLTDTSMLEAHWTSYRFRKPPKGCENPMYQ